MVKERMDLLELLRKGGMDGDVDFLREALRVLVEGIMDAEVSSRIGAEYGERSPERVTQGFAPKVPVVPKVGVLFLKSIASAKGQVSTSCSRLRTLHMKLSPCHLDEGNHLLNRMRPEQ